MAAVGEGNGSCNNFTSRGFIIITAINKASACVTLLACLLVIGTILLFKKYMLYTQRLILYLSVSAALHSLSQAAGASVFFPMNDSYNYSAYCIWSGFFFQYTGWMFLVSLSIIVADMYARVVLQKETPHREWIYILAIFVLPLLVNWIPFIDHAYGQAGPWCWIRSVNYDDNCSIYPLGLVWQVVLLYGPLFTLCIVAIVLSILLVRHLYRHKYTGKYDPHEDKQKKLMLKEAIPFVIYPWIFLFINGVSLMHRIVVAVTHDQRRILVLWGASVVLTITQGGIATVIFGLDLDTLRRLFQVSSYLCCCQQKVEEYPVNMHEQTDSYRQPRRQTRDGT